MSAHPETKQYPVSHTEAEWRKILTPEQYHIMREHGTEMPGSCALLVEKRPGKFSCAGCGTTRRYGSGGGSCGGPAPAGVDACCVGAIVGSAAGGGRRKAPRPDRQRR